MASALNRKHTEQSESTEQQKVRGGRDGQRVRVETGEDRKIRDRERVFELC